MKLHGRITFFGEYLLKENLSYCLCIKSKLFLSNEEQYESIKHPTYSNSKDKTIPMLQSLGVNSFSKIYGNLPLGYGLSSSTILSLLHLNSAERKDLIEIVDKEMNGFSPSELDYTSITKQENGVYGFGNWFPFQNFQPVYSLVVIPKEGKRNLPKIKSKLVASQPQQIKLTKELFQQLSSVGELDFNLLFEYSQLLLSCKIYSDQTHNIASTLLDKNISCKCIGGIYDTALLVLHPDNTSKLECDKFILDNFNFASIIE